MPSDFHFEGGAELAANLKDLSITMEKKINGQASRGGAVAYRKKLKARLPRSEGEKLRKWRINQGKNKVGQVDNVHVADSLAVAKAGSTLYKVGVIGLAKAYAHILEFGSKYMSGNEVWTNTLRREEGTIMDAMAKKARAAIERAQ